MERTPPAPAARFTKVSRLRRRGEFSQVFETGARVQARYFTLLLMPADGLRPRLGIVASRKLGDAVRRNRAKRLIREMFRQLPPMPGPRGVDIVVIPRRELFDAPYSSLETDFRGAFRRGVTRLPARVSR